MNIKAVCTQGHSRKRLRRLRMKFLVSFFKRVPFITVGVFKPCCFIHWYYWTRLPSKCSHSVQEMWRNVRKRTYMCTHRRFKSVRAVWSVFVVRMKKFCSLGFVQYNVPREDSDQPARMRRLIWIFAGRICPKVRFLTFRLNLFRCSSPAHCLKITECILLAATPRPLDHDTRMCRVVCAFAGGVYHTGFFSLPRP